MRRRHEAPDPGPKPDFSVRYLRSSFEVYNFETLARPTGNPRRVYDKRDFGGNVERVTLDEQIIAVGSQDAGLALNLRVHLDPFLEQGNYESMQQFFKGICLEGTSHQQAFANVLSLTTPNGLKLLVHFDFTAKTIVASNFMTSSNSQQEISITPISHQEIDFKSQLIELGPAMIALIDAASYHYDPKKRKSDKKGPYGYARAYRIGEKIIATPRDSGRQLGRVVVQNLTSPNQSTNEHPNDLPEDIPFNPTGELAELGTEGITLDDVGGLEDIKSDLKDAALSFAHPEIMAKWDAERPQGILLHGPPGTGKTMLIKAFANEINAKLKLVDSTIYDKWLGNSQKGLAAIFDELEQVQERTVVLFDEFDSIISTVDEPVGADNARNEVAGLFKTRMNDLAEKNPNVIIAATTNDIDRIDPALIRTGRFNFRRFVPMPDDRGRSQIISNIMAKKIETKHDDDFSIFGEGIDVPTVVRLTDGLSGSDITEIFRRLTFNKAIKEIRTGKSEPITQAELAEAIQDFRIELI